MADTKELKIVINGDVKDAEGALNQFSSRVGSISPLAIAAGVALERLGEKVISMGIDFVKGSVKAYEESQNLNTQLSAVLKSTGEAAGLTKDQLIDLSKQLQSSTTFSDEQVLSAENLLLTFTKIGKETFPDATTAVLNMATALGEDTKSASIQLGKALQDPILGVTALRRVGVNFNNDQREVIKNLVETGHQLDAQKLILKELNVEFGGSAAAAATTYQGRLKQLENTFNDTKEVVGRFIVNGIYPFIQATIPLAQAVLKLVEGNGSWSDIHKALLTQFPQLTAAINLIWNTIQKAFTPVVKELNEIWAKHKEELVLIGQFIGGTLLIVLSALIVILGKLIEIVLQVVNAFLNFVEFIKKPVSEALDLLNKGLIATEKFFENLGKTVNSITKSITDAIRGMVTDAINSINKLIDGFNTLGGKIPGVPKISIPHIPGLASGTDYFSGGVALVGEQGAELVNLPQGASVTPADKTASMMGGATVNIYNPVVRSNSDIDMIVDQVRRVLGRDTELARLRAI